MSLTGKICHNLTRPLARIAQDAGFMFSAGTLGVILSATERYGISDAPLTSPLVWGAAAATLTSTFFIANKYPKSWSMAANAAMLLGGSAFLLASGGGSAFLIPAAMMLTLGTASLINTFEYVTGHKTPWLNSEAFVGLGGIGIAYTMGGGPAGAMAALLAATGLYFSTRGRGEKPSEAFANAMNSRACFMGINILSAAFAFGKADDLLALKTLSGVIGPALLLLGNIAVYRDNRNKRDEALRQELSPAPSAS